jgi:hypothetical protein
MSKSKGWIGVDLDGTLAEYHGWHLDGSVGKPVKRMLSRVRHWLTEGIEVRIVTARAGIPEQIPIVEAWCLENIGVKLKVTNQKDLQMIQLWDDRCVQIEPNTGRIVGNPEITLPLPAEAFD